MNPQDEDKTEETQTKQQFQILDTKLDSLNELIIYLGTLLEPVLRNEPPDDGVRAEPEEPRCSDLVLLAKKIRQKRLSVDSMVKTIQSYIYRMEL
jgi:hypothetical protein